MDIFLTAILAATLGLLAWAAQGWIAYRVKGHRLRAYAVVLVNTHLSDLQEVEPMVQRVVNELFRIQHPVFGGVYEASSLEDFRELRSMAVPLLSTTEMRRLTHTVDAFAAYEHRLASFYAQGHRALKDSNAGRDPKAASLLALIEADHLRELHASFPASIRKLRDLPDSYPRLRDPRQAIEQALADFEAAEAAGAKT